MAANTQSAVDGAERDADESPVERLLDAVRRSDADVDTTEFRIERGQYDDRLVAKSPNDDPDQFDAIKQAARSVGWEVKDYSSGIGRIGIPRLNLEFVPRDVALNLDTARKEERDQPGQRVEVDWLRDTGGLRRRVNGTGLIVDPEELVEGDEVWVEYGDVRDIGGYRYRAYGQQFKTSVVDVSEDRVELENEVELRLDKDARTGDPALEELGAKRFNDGQQAAQTVVRID